MSVFIVASSLAFAAFAASAASLGGVATPQIFAQMGPAAVDIPVAPIVEDDFSTCSGLLDGQTTPQGHLWTDHWGRWQCLAGDLVRTQWRVPLGSATVDVGRSDDIVVTATFDRVSTQNNRSGPGISLFHDGFFHMYVIYERDQGRVTLGKWSPWANTSISSVPISGAIGSMSVVIDQPNLTVLVDGGQVMSFDLSTLPQDERDQFLGQTRFGLEADSDNWSRFSSFTVETLP